ncbi:hypothetical protein TKWG_14820 [Advenella kashmirensis WT001]|uniref:Uncharacterized protein n=1 Tax=Advenella kashmirensis (strain DSM 17095 / LMG 22695 / WT001) TaxID=1036672 RepID=I3UDC0_ADVKW|nr:hypothetical protein TKWG_14820 [Advenella kashmirensis WT001]
MRGVGALMPLIAWHGRLFRELSGRRVGDRGQTESGSRKGTKAAKNVLLTIVMAQWGMERASRELKML